MFGGSDVRDTIDRILKEESFIEPAGETIQHEGTEGEDQIRGPKTFKCLVW